MRWSPVCLLLFTACGGDPIVPDPPVDTLATAVTDVVRTFRAGRLRVLERARGPDTARIAIDSVFGGTIVELSRNGRNVVNAYDAGREIQLALYDANHRYDACAGCTAVWGWDPVQGGDKYGHGSPVLALTDTGGRLYVRVQPVQWNPDDKGGGPDAAVPTDVEFEQWIEPGDSMGMFRVRYVIRHLAGDSHAVASQEVPAVYANLEFGTVAHYAGDQPWTGAPVRLSSPGDVFTDARSFRTTEHWAAWVDGTGFGLAIWMPLSYPLVAGGRASGTGGTNGTGTNYFRPEVPFGLVPGTVVASEVFVAVGDYRRARVGFAALRSTVTMNDVLVPIGYLDIPAPGDSLTGVVDVAGWSVDNVGIVEVQVLLDGAVVGTATYGAFRPDVATALGGGSPNVGFTYRLDTSAYGPGPHVIAIAARDAAGNRLEREAAVRW